MEYCARMGYRHRKWFQEPSERIAVGLVGGVGTIAWATS
jgi:hypothetical protein